MELMADGLAGHEFDFYSYVKHSHWTGGHHDYSDLHEAAPYWFNYIVPLAYGLDDPRLKDQIRQFVDFVITAQSWDGWLGPETTEATRDLWARFPLMLGLSQLVEADESYAEEVIPAMYRFIRIMQDMLSNDYQGYVSWGRARGHDMVLTVQWLYENYPMDDYHQWVLVDTMKMLIEGAFNWPYFFSEDVFPKQDLDTLPDFNLPYDFQHVVNVGQALKSAAVIRRMSRNDSLLETARNAVNWTFMYHGSPSGAIIGDERISGVSPRRGYLYRAIGDKSFADRCERTAFNALPVMMSPDWWAHQYVAQTNQPYSRPLPESPFFNVNNRGQTYGLEPHYPCCTVNHPQGYPKFLSASFVRVGQHGLGHALLSPARLSTSLEKGENPITIDCQTNYPFENILLYTITALKPFRFSIRVPEWYIPEESYLRINNGHRLRLHPDEESGMHTLQIHAGITTVTYHLGAEIRIEPRANDTIAIHHGALLYALEIGQKVTSRPPRSFFQQPLPEKDILPQTRDYTIMNTTAWAVAIDPTSLKFHPSKSNARDQNRVEDDDGEEEEEQKKDKFGMEEVVHPLPNPIFKPGSPPTFITARACEIEWSYEHGFPSIPPLLRERKCVSEVYQVKLIPYGAAKIHMAELPTLNLSSSASWGDLGGDRGHESDEPKERCKQMVYKEDEWSWQKEEKKARKKQEEEEDGWKEL
ncbi:MAG: hypothetical protein M1823_003184 [Watsoniomyces obsoletus]|nr:MAG: hypothetical protein M1823_003184 [Watsoniomyces obsoletus]